MRRPSVAIIGLGLVGGSLARALTRKGYRVTGIDWPLVVRQAQRTRAITRGATRAEAAARSDVVVLAAPPATNLRLLKRLAKVAPPGLILTDVSSVKRAIVGEAARLGLRGFVGGHPMAGTEKQGFSASRADLFEGATWWLVPAPSRRANRAVRALVRDAGARPVITAAARHDRVMAFLSHAPQVVAWALLDAGTRRPRRPAAAAPRRPRLSRHDAARAQPARALARYPRSQPRRGDARALWPAARPRKEKAMSRGGAPDPQVALVRVPRVLLGSSVAVLAVAAYVNAQKLSVGSSDLVVISWMAVAWAALAPVVATIVRGQGLVPVPPSQPESAADLTVRLQKTIVFFGVLESAVAFAAAALIASPANWPLFAALFPLAVMALNLPKRPAS